MFEPMAEYEEVRPDGRRHFELFKDRLVIRSRSSNLDSEITVKMADLRSEPNRLLVRPAGFRLGLILLVVSVITAVWGAAPKVDPGPHDQHLIPLVGAGFLAVISLAFISKTARKIEFLQFVSHNGHPMFDIARAGPRRARFDAFVQALTERIRAASGKGEAKSDEELGAGSTTLRA